MRSPQDMQIIQIDITNACINRCSNCTRFCGHHKKPFFMDYETFKKAVDSFDGYEGCVGIIGGEPTLHPELEKFIDYIREKRIGKILPLSREPISDMQDHLYKKLNNQCSKVGFWSSLNKGYYKNFEAINDTFEWQLLNDHNNNCLHQAILMARKDLGISDDEFIKRRDNCFAQNSWSATVTPKGAFFCEIAGALDMLFDGPGGWPIEKGWWKKQPEEFSEQLQWCELCSLCLDVPKRISSEEVDDISPILFEKLKEVDSPKLKQGRYCLHEKNNYEINKATYKSFESANDYMQAGNNIRTTTDNKNYYPRIFTVATQDNVVSLIDKNTDWVVLSANKRNTNKIIKYLKNNVINPGCLYKYKNEVIFNVMARSIREQLITLENIDFSMLESYYPDDKIITITKLYSNNKVIRKLQNYKDKLDKISKYRW